jgi:hypothetical protein
LNQNEQLIKKNAKISNWLKFFPNLTAEGAANPTPAPSAPAKV